MQTCASICTVLGEKLLELRVVSAKQVELWLYSYLGTFFTHANSSGWLNTSELLERLELWTIAASMVKTCYRPRINQLSNEVKHDNTFVLTASLHLEHVRETHVYQLPRHGDECFDQVPEVWGTV